MLGDQSRIRILRALQDGEMNVSALCKLLKMRQPAVSHHLGILRSGRLVDYRREGKQVFYSIREPEKQTKKAVKSFLGEKGFLQLGSIVVGIVKD